jgi:hypothetical protein
LTPGAPILRGCVLDGPSQAVLDPDSDNLELEQATLGLNMVATEQLWVDAQNLDQRHRNCSQEVSK